MTQNTHPGCVRAIWSRRLMEMHQMTWPPQSPDFDPIEMVWDELDRRVKEKQPTSAQHMWELLQDCWKSFPHETGWENVKSLQSCHQGKGLLLWKNTNICLMLFWLLHDSICLISQFWCLHYFSTCRTFVKNKIKTLEWVGVLKLLIGSVYNLMNYENKHASLTTGRNLKSIPPGSYQALVGGLCSRSLPGCPTRIWGLPCPCDPIGRRWWCHWTRWHWPHCDQTLCPSHGCPPPVQPYPLLLHTHTRCRSMREEKNRREQVK